MLSLFTLFYRLSNFVWMVNCTLYILSQIKMNLNFSYGYIDILMVLTTKLLTLQLVDE